MFDLISRIHKSVSESFKIVYMTEDVCGYIFFILGTSGFIYRIVINKKYQKCNCDDYYNHKVLCKHILFVLFKVIRLYRITFENQIFLIRNDSDFYKYTDFIKDGKFPELDWSLFKSYYRKMNLKKRYYDISLSTKFKSHFVQFNYIAKKNIHYKKSTCPICKDLTSYSVRCDVCKSLFHSICIFEWLDSIIKKRCPICRSDCFEKIYPYGYLLKNEKIPLSLFQNN